MYFLKSFQCLPLLAILSPALAPLVEAAAASTAQPTTNPAAGTKESAIVKAAATPSAAAAAAACSDLLVDDFASQSQLTFLNYNVLVQASSDDATMKSLMVSKNRLTLTPTNTGSYFYTIFGCLSATNTYNGLGWLIKAPSGSSFQIELQTSPTCNGDQPVSNVLTTRQLGWTFDGTEKYYAMPFSKFSGLDTGHLTAIVFSNFGRPTSFGPIAFYCGIGSAYPIPQTVQPVEPRGTVPATTGPSAFVVDRFANRDSNALGFYHGGDDPATYKIANGKLTFTTKGNSDLSWYTQLSGTCSDFTVNDKSYVHIAYTGSAAFSVALQQHNPTCNENIAPYPQTWDDVVAARYSNSAKTDIYIPLSHFRIDRKKAIGFALKGFYTSDTTVISLIEIVKTVPSGFLVPSKLDTAPLYFACTRPNSFAFAIDDGIPDLAQQVVTSISRANIKVTFFTVGLPLLDASNNFTVLYKDMLTKGHQIALHSYTHPPMEGLPDLAAIDWELNKDIDAVQRSLGVTSKYFRPPFGTEGARIRQRLAAVIPDSKFVAWSVDVEDYLWAESSTPSKQVDAFRRDVNKGGNLVVMHYLYPSTVSYLDQFISIAKGTGKQLMRVDQCLEDPGAPPL
ncbi:MAG: hypothetical protein M1814_000563 [Vezdaea aestivalis]|nr:MAG: hypothetical protein M1814_000563 [Vezdaea aestivalis]